LVASVLPQYLTKEEVSDFVERGWTVLRGGFSREVADAVVDALSLKCATNLRDPNDWKVPSIWLREAYSGSPWIDAATPAFASAMDQLVGMNRWQPLTQMGWWPIRFPGFKNPPFGQEWHAGDDWHVDGRFPHGLTSPEQAILNFFLFTDLEPGGGGTLFAEGSHLRAAEILAAIRPAAIDADELTARVASIPGAFDSIAETTGAAGDIILAHPLLLHSSSHNAGTRPRVMASPRTDCFAPKRFEGADLSPVEIVLARGLQRLR